MYSSKEERGLIEEVLQESGVSPPFLIELHFPLDVSVSLEEYVRREERL